MNRGLWIADCGLWITDWTLQNRRGARLCALGVRQRQLLPCPAFSPERPSALPPGESQGEGNSGWHRHLAGGCSTPTPPVSFPRVPSAPVIPAEAGIQIVKNLPFRIFSISPTLFRVLNLLCNQMNIIGLTIQFHIYDDWQ